MSALVYANKRGVTEARSCVNGNAPLLFLYHKRMISGESSFSGPIINEAAVLTSNHLYLPTVTGRHRFQRYSRTPIGCGPC